MRLTNHDLNRNTEAAVAIRKALKKDLSDADKDKARQRVRDAVRYGKLAKPFVCDVCGMPTPRELLHGHHHNGYENPLDVVWLCVHCHNSRHRPDLSGQGERNSFAKLRDADVAAIRELRAKGENLRIIAGRFNISIPTACQVATGKTWKHLSGGVESRHAESPCKHGGSPKDPVTTGAHSLVNGNNDSGSSAPPAQSPCDINHVFADIRRRFLK